jgi:hypothetical protein
MRASESSWGSVRACYCGLQGQCESKTLAVLFCTAPRGTGATTPGCRPTRWTGRRTGTPPAVMTLPHAHKDGVTCEEHCRCGVLLDGTFVSVDVPAWFVGTLPEKEFVLDGQPQSRPVGMADSLYETCRHVGVVRTPRSTRRTRPTRPRVGPGRRSGERPPGRADRSPDPVRVGGTGRFTGRRASRRG